MLIGAAARRVTESIVSVNRFCNLTLSFARAFSLLGQKKEAAALAVLIDSALRQPLLLYAFVNHTVFAQRTHDRIKRLVVRLCERESVFALDFSHYV